ncbi:MAG TPA: cupin domain-containing protein [Nocardioidaceae bacterium]|nr:cupin domain-containing protein [Nocardioidaceae bacterium]
MNALDLLSGDAQAFLDKVWASRVHLHHTDPTDLVGLLSLDDVDHLLTSVALRTPALRVVKDGAVLPSSQFTRSATMAGSPLTGLVDSRRVLAHFDAGATVVLQGLHRYWPPLTRLVRELELALGHPCQANAYLTPPGSQGFARHSDSHDVFVFQTHGRKLWEIVEGGEEREVVLEPGLSMYLPTGTPHSARSQEHTSLHVTVGINQLTWREVLRKLGDRVLSDERYDARLPAGYPGDPSLLAGRLAEELDAFASGLGSLDAEVVAEERAGAFLTERTPTLRGGLNDLVALDSLGDDSVVERRATAACVLRPGPDRLSLLLGDRELRMPLRLTGAMEFVRDNASFRVGELAPWLDAESRLVVARRLVREGLLRIAQ